MNPIKLVRVRDVMKTAFDRVDGIMTVADALSKMKHPEVKAMLVNKRHADDEFGIVLLSDIARHVLAKDRSPERVNIYEIMTKPALTVSPKMDIRYCARLLDSFNVLRAPVVENEEVIGIVGFSDIVLQGMEQYCQ
jgi:signal-transduction protein with cAMP-binding, CBS, and nucleotidyltransferase domain